MKPLSALPPGVIGFGFMTLVKITGGLLMIKLMAVRLGPELFGQLGQLMGLVAMVSMLAGGGTTNGLIALLSGSDDKQARQRTLGAALQIYVAFAAGISLILGFGSASLSRILLSRPDMGWVFILLAATQWLVGAGNLLQGLLSVHRKVHFIVRLNIIGIILGAALFVLLLLKFGYAGAAAGIVLFPAATGLSGLLTAALALPKSDRKIDWQHTETHRSKLLSYALVMLVTIVAMPTAQLVVRNMVGHTAGWDFAGYWQGVIKVSDVYMQFIGMILIYVALPRFSSHRTAATLEKEARQIRTQLLPLAAAGLLAAWVLRDAVIHVLFSPDFAPARHYFLPQMGGDFLRIVSLIFVYMGLSRGDRVIAIAYEITQALLLVLLSHLLLASYGGAAPAYAHFLASCGSLLMVLTLVWRRRQGWFA